MAHRAGAGCGVQGRYSVESGMRNGNQEAQRRQGAELGSYFGCRTVNFSAAAALFSFSSKQDR